MKPSLITILMLIAASAFGQDLEEIKAHFQNRESEKVIEAGKKLLEEYPDDPMVNHLTGRALADLSRFEEAKVYLKKSIGEEAFDWMQAWSHGYLGLCYFSTEEYETAKWHLNKALDLDATKNATQFAKNKLHLFQLTDYFDDWEIIETPHIRFHMQPGHGIRDLDAYCNSREDAYQEVNQLFEAEPYKKIDYFIWSKPKKAKQLFGKPLGFSRPGVCIINSAIRQTRGHEITHILSDHGIKPEVKNRLINEGVAVAFDLSERDRMKMAREANSDNWTIQELMDQSGALSEATVYPIGGAFIEFLMEKKGGDTLKLLLKEQTYERLLELYGEELIKAFEKRIYHPSSK
jgi:tetratricopeptide (TPR) repeat protein